MIAQTASSEASLNSKIDKVYTLFKSFMTHSILTMMFLTHQSVLWSSMTRRLKHLFLLIPVSL